MENYDQGVDPPASGMALLHGLFAECGDEAVFNVFVGVGEIERLLMEDRHLAAQITELVAGGIGDLSMFSACLE